VQSDWHRARNFHDRTVSYFSTRQIYNLDPIHFDSRTVRSRLKIIFKDIAPDNPHLSIKMTGGAINSSSAQVRCDSPLRVLSIELEELRKVMIPGRIAPAISQSTGHVEFPVQYVSGQVVITAKHTRNELPVLWRLKVFRLGDLF
jgi:hypothetical protein